MSQQQPPRLLLVDPISCADPLLLDTLMQGGFELELCSEPDAAIALLAMDAAIDLVVVCTELKDDQLQRLRRAAGTVSQAVPLLLVGSREPERALDAGADDVLRRPFGLAELLARCRALVRRRQLAMPQRTVLRCGPIEMVLEEHEVRRDGAVVTLSPREFRLLHFLLEHQRRIWPREELLTQVWGELEGPSLDPKTVDVHIHWLRLKLEDDPADPRLITTVRGRGYRLG
ncbi:MAG: response regulator transcription factor [Synechococcaceae cyanobacterium]